MSGFEECLNTMWQYLSEDDFKLVKVFLGEWAWKEFGFTGKPFVWFKKRAEEYPGIGWTVYFNLAVACLGEKEVRKRLKAGKK